MSDLISRSALLEELEEFAKDDQWREKRTIRERWLRREGILIMMKGVENFPAVDAVPVVHGKPEPHMVQYISYGGKVVAEFQAGWHCPFCREPGVKNYCPNCGAKMDGGEEDG